MNRSLFSLLLRSFLGCAFCAAAHGQSAGTVVVTGAREPIAIERLAADVVVIDRATIEASTADSVADLLRREAGAQLSRNGGPGQSTGVLLRGAASVNTLVLVDGVRIGSATLGFAQLDGLSLAQIERIEVLRGPASSLYGADAVGGVVHVITRRAEAGNRLDGHLAVGGFGGREASVALRGAQAGWDYALTLGTERSHGVSALRPGDLFGNHNPDADGHALDAVQLRLGLALLAGQRISLTLLRNRLDAQYDGSEFLPPAYAQDASPDFRNRLATDLVALEWRGTLGGLTGTARASQAVDDLQSGGRQTDRFRTTRDRLSAQLSGALSGPAAALGEWVAGLEQLDERATTTSLPQGVSRRNAALMLALSGAKAAWAWQADLRRDDDGDFGAVTTARLGGSLQVTPALRLRALGGSTFRAPSFNDLYYPGYGVATLSPERGRSLEAGLVWREGASDAAFTVYRNRVRDLIGYESDGRLCPDDPAYAYGCARNLDRARLQGATLSAGHQAGALGLQAQVDLVDAKDEATGQRLNRRAAHQASLAAEWRQAAWSFGASMLRLGARPDGGVELAAETTWDLSAGWRPAPGWQLQLRLLNATDRDLQPARDYQGLGRQAWLLLRYGQGL